MQCSGVELITETLVNIMKWVTIPFLEPYLLTKRHILMLTIIFIAGIIRYATHSVNSETEEVDPSDLITGDHIFVPGSVSRGLKVKGLVGYYHHGIYLGLIDGGKMVTDFGAVNKSRPVIREFDKFLNGYSHQLYRRNYQDESKILAPEKSLELAKLISSGKHPWSKYNLNTNNCEHYASFLKMSQSVSLQIVELPVDILLHIFYYLMQ